MARYIDADRYCELNGCKEPGNAECSNCIIVDCETADVKPVVHACWQKCNSKAITEDMKLISTWYCSNCGWGCNCSKFLGFDYCPNCGAEMELSK